MATVAVVGSGFSGTLMAVHLLRTTDAGVLLIERGNRFARGVAYSTVQPGHRLNVRARDMSAFPDRPDHFAAWLGEQQAGDPDSFASRGRFGDYLGTLLVEAEGAHPGRLRRCGGEVTGLVPESMGYRLLMASGSDLSAEAVVLAIGNLPPHDPPGLSADALSPDVYVADPWGEDLSAGLAPGDDVAVIGTGLTMVDVVIELRAAGFRGSVTALSRRGLLPRGHAAVFAGHGECQATDVRPASLSKRLGVLRNRTESIGWRAAVDELRPVTQDLWMAASAETRGRFLRHLRPWWDVHRHRLAPSVAATVEAALADGGLSVEAGRLLPAVPVSGGVELSWRPRGNGTVRRQRFRRVINCTGPSSNILRTPDPLLSALVTAGAIRPDPLLVGIDVADGGQVLSAEGRADPRLFVVGPMSRGAYWEIIAVPDIRVQVQAVAAEVAAALAA